MRPLSKIGTTSFIKTTSLSKEDATKVDLKEKKQSFSKVTCLYDKQHPLLLIIEDIKC